MTIDEQTAPHLTGDPFTATGVDERHREYARLAAAGPVQRIVLPDGTAAWLVLGYGAARAALTEPRLVKTAHPAGRLALRHEPQVYGSIRNHLLLRDGEAHARMRRLVGAAFTVRRVQALAPRIQAIADGLLDAFGAEREVDLVAAYALPLPMAVICELIGVPESLRPPLRESTATMIAGVFAPPDDYVEAIRTHAAVARELVALKRREPADDLLSALVAARDTAGEPGSRPDAADRLSEDELTSLLSLLVIAGHETTAHQIGNGVLLVLRHPDQLQLVRSDPQRMADVVEEMLRAEGPLQTTLPLRATAPLRLHGVEISVGDTVLVALLAANRDPVKFSDGAHFDITRGPGSHLAFGHGIHHCLGAPLARLEVSLALSSLLARFPSLRLAVPPDRLRRHPNTLIHGLKALPVRLH